MLSKLELLMLEHQDEFGAACFAEMNLVEGICLPVLREGLALLESNQAAELPSFCKHLIDCRDPFDGCNLLLLAAGAGISSIVSVLLSFAALGLLDAHGRSFCGETALHLAASAGHVEICKELLQRTNLQVSGPDAETRNGVVPTQGCSRQVSEALRALQPSGCVFLCGPPADGDPEVVRAACLLKNGLLQRGLRVMSMSDTKAENVDTALLKHEVAISSVVVVLLTPQLLHDPFCILALAATYTMGKAAVGVLVEGLTSGTYDEEVAAHALHGLPAYLTSSYPEALLRLQQHRVDVGDAGRKCRNLVLSMRGSTMVRMDVRAVGESSLVVASIQQALTEAKPSTIVVQEARSRLVIRECLSGHLARFRTRSRVMRKMNVMNLQRLRRVSDGGEVKLPRLREASQMSPGLQYHVFLSHRAILIRSFPVAS